MHYIIACSSLLPIAEANQSAGLQHSTVWNSLLMFTVYDEVLQLKYDARCGYGIFSAFLLWLRLLTLYSLPSNRLVFESNDMWIIAIIYNLITINCYLLNRQCAHHRITGTIDVVWLLNVFLARPKKEPAGAQVQCKYQDRKLLLRNRNRLRLLSIFTSAITITRNMRCNR